MMSILKLYKYEPAIAFLKKHYEGERLENAVCELDCIHDEFYELIEQGEIEDTAPTWSELELLKMGENN